MFYLPFIITVLLEDNILYIIMAHKLFFKIYSNAQFLYTNEE